MCTPRHDLSPSTVLFTVETNHWSSRLGLITYCRTGKSSLVVLKYDKTFKLVVLKYKCHGDMGRGRLAQTYASREGDMS